MIDFPKITTSSRRYNFHAHTQFCDGRAPMEDFIVKAIEEGFTDYGFSPHSPIPFESPCNMKQSDVAAYTAETERLKALYGDRINIYRSMEIDYIDANWGPSSPYFDSLGLDYRIGSVHFIPCGDIFVDTDGRYSSFQVKMEKYFDNDIRYVVDSFYRQTLAMIEAGGFDIIGHFDKIGSNASYFQPGIENEEWYAAHVKNVIEAIKDNHLIVEINTKSLAEHGRFFPNARYFEAIRRYDIPVIVDSDAHVPALINAGRFEAFEAYFK